MPSLAQALVAHIDERQRSLETDGVRPLDGTDRIISHKRRVRQGTTAGLALLAGGALATSGVVAAKRAADQEPGTHYLPEGGGLVTMDADGPDPTVPELAYKCDDPAPEPRLADDGFELSLKASDIYQSGMALNLILVDAKVTNMNEEQFPAYVLTSYQVIAQDGVVVGYTEPTPMSNTLPFTPTRTDQPEQVYIWPSWETCTGGPVEYGDYEVYVVSTVANSPEIAALASLKGGYGPPVAFVQDRHLIPTDWECSHDVIGGMEATEAFSASPSRKAPCVAGNHPRARWDPNERTITVGYGDNRVSRVFTTTLVSEPLTYTVTDGSFRTGEYVAPDAPTVDSHSRCEAVIPDSNWDSPLYVYAGNFTGERLAAGERLDTRVWAEFGPQGIEARSAEVSFPERSRIYFTHLREVRVGDNLIGYEDTVVGWAWVSVDEGRTVVIGRATGPTPVDLTLQGVSWCGGEPPAGALRATVVGPVTVASDAGIHELQAFSIYLGAATN